MKRISTLFTFISCCIAIFTFGCEDGIVGDSNENELPETTIFVKGNLDTTQSVQTLYWDGSDPDGFVTGFYYTFEDNPVESDWIFTTERSNEFALPLQSEFAAYTFQVKAVDNDGEEDPTPASQVFSIRNTQPDIRWSNNSDIPDTTFTVATFSWVTTDTDGDETITAIEYALDDTSSWITLPKDAKNVLLSATDGLDEGEHVFYVRAVDIAGARSEAIRMPQDPLRTWYVREPQGRYLLIDDYSIESASSGRPDAFYRGFLDTFLTAAGQSYNYWNIEADFPASSVQFSETLKLFDRVIWYTDIVQNSDPHFIYAQSAIPEFRQNGGKLLYTVQFNTGFGTQGDPLGFAPIESLGQRFNFISTNSTYFPDPTFATEFPTLPALPNLTVSNFILGVFALTPSANAVPIYRYDDPSTTNDPIFVVAGRNDNSGEYDFVFSGTPLHLLRGSAGLESVMKIFLNDLLGI